MYRIFVSRHLSSIFLRVLSFWTNTDASSVSRGVPFFWSLDVFRFSLIF